MVTADSRNYRPFSGGATWTYRQYARGTSLPSERRVRQISDGAAGIRELDLSGFDADVNLQRSSNGDTLTSTLIPISASRSVPVSGPELTRELRAGQQIVVFDSRIADVGDLDADGRSDSLDVAVWRNVVGLEDQVLPATGAALRALRIDDRVVLRTVLTGGGAPQRIEARGSSWYADGVGLVRTLTLADDGVTAEDDRRLSGFDAGSRGLGMVPLSEGRVYFPEAAGRALVLGNESLHLESSLEITRRDNRGGTLGTASSRRDGDSPISAQSLLQTRDGLRLVSQPSSGIAGTVLVDALDANGRMTASRLSRVEISAEAGAFCAGDCLRVRAHPSSSTMWLVSVEQLSPSPGVFERPLTVRRMGSDGVLRGEPVRYTPPFTTSFISIQILDAVARPSGLSVLLTQNDGGVDAAMRLVEFDESGAVVLSRRYKPLTTSFSSDWERARILVDGDTRWLAWRGDGASSARVVRLAADGTPVGVADTPAGLAGARIDAWPEAVRVNWPYNVTVAGGAWWISGNEFSSEFDAGAGGNTRHTVLARLEPSDEAGLRGAPRLLRSSLFEVGLQGLVFGDRLLWGSFSGGLGPPLLVWR